MSKARVSKHDLRELAREFEGDDAQRRDVIEDWRQIYGVSPQTVYRWAREGGYQGERKRRKDTGKKHSGVDAEAVERAVMARYLTSTAKHGSPMPAEVAIEITETASEGVRPHHVNALAREMGLNRQALGKPTPHIVRSTERPNQEHQFDTSICRIWYIDKKARVRVDRLRGMDKNKEPRGTPIVRYVVVDHFTHAFFFQYQNEIESFAASAKFLHQAWARKPDPSIFPFCGVPQRLYIDQGPTFKSANFKQLCENLGIELQPKQPTGTRSKSGKLGNPRALGAVECAHWMIETCFESRFRFKKPESLDELNEWAYRWCIWWNACKKHYRYGMSRMQLWSIIRNEELRVPPGDFSAFITLAAQWMQCNIYCDLTIRFKGHRYLLRNASVDLVNTKADVMYSPFEFPEILVRGVDGNLYKARPLVKYEPFKGGYYDHAVPTGSFRAHKDTVTERSQKLAEGADMGPIDPFPDFAQRLENLHYLSKPGREIDIKEWPVVIPMMDALARMQEALRRPVTSDENKALREKYGDCMRYHELDAELQQLFGK